jgi:hypothetical protein
MHVNTVDCTGEENNSEILMKNAMDLDSTFLSEPNASVLQKLLWASKEAEVLIACIFEIDSITAAPLLEIWSRFAAAINEAQLALQADRIHELSAHRIRRL